LNKLFISFLVFYGISQATLANTTIDSLNHVNDSLRKQNLSGVRFLVFAELAAAYEKIKDTSNLVSSTIEMAEMSRSSGSQYIALDILTELTNSSYQINPAQEIKINLIKGASFYEVPNKDSSILFSRKGLELSRLYKIDRYRPLLMNLLGSSYIKSNQDSALKWINLSVQGFLAQKDTNGSILPRINLSILYYDLGKLEESRRVLEEAIVDLDQNDVLIYRKMCYASLSVTYLSLHNYEKSIHFLNLRDSVSLEINNNQIQFQVSQFQSKLEEEQISRELMTLETKIEMIELENQRNSILVIFSLILIVALGIGLFFAVKNNRNKKEINNLISKKAKDLETVNDFKNQILSVISHDMRSPLAQVITFQHAKNSGINFSPDEIREMDKTIMASAKNGLLILDNLLKWASNQFSGDELKTENFSAKFVITQILNQVSELGKEKEITIHSDIANIEIHSNESLFQIIIRNLLSNAIKFSPLHSEIRISAVLSRGFLVIHISDQGPGIPPKIMEAIQNGENVKPKIGSFGEKGAGIGLSFSKDFAHRIGGEITFSKELLIGTEAIFKVPIGKVD
jgi:signal transduction histidine kinase